MNWVFFGEVKKSWCWMDLIYTFAKIINLLEIPEKRLVL